MRFAYELPSGEIEWRIFRMGEAPKEIEVDGVVAKRCYRAENKGGPAPKGWPMTCYASGVNADQAQELRDELRRKGVPTEVTADGDPIYTSPDHRRRALKARGMIDRGSYY